MVWRWLQVRWYRLVTLPPGYHGDMNTMPITITHRPEQLCFEAIVDGHRCVADYQRQGTLLRMTHTFVHPALEGRGIAAQLVQAALAWAQAEGLRVDPVCSYVRVYIKRHPQWQGLLG